MLVLAYFLFDLEQEKEWIKTNTLDADSDFADFFLFIYLFAFPKLFPFLAYNVVPQYVRHEILKSTIPKFKVGDDLSELQKVLPVEFEFEDCYGNRGAMLEDFQYVIEVNCCKIVRIEYGPRGETGYAMGGKRKPCS